MALGPVSSPLPARRDDWAVRVRTARAIALFVDLIQIVFVPLFAPGAVSPAEDLLDVLAAIVLVRLLGWHWSFLPSFAAELVPGLDLIPTWSAAVFFATRGSKGKVDKQAKPPLLP